MNQMDVSTSDRTVGDPSSSSSIVSPHDRIEEFKSRLASRLCLELLSVPIPPVGALRIPADATPGERAELARQHAVATLHREEALKRSEGELVTQLTELMDRVVRSRDEAVVDNTEVWSTQKYERQSVEFECDLCHNKDRDGFVTDSRSGDTICLGLDRSIGCGNIVRDHRVDEGAQFRVFADDEGKDRNHHGPTPDALMPDSENMRTAMIGAGALFRKLAHTHEFVEANLRNKHKRAAFALMEDAGSALGIHEAVLARAKQEFAHYRDVREHIVHFHPIVAACMAIAFSDLVHANVLTDYAKGGQAGGAISSQGTAAPKAEVTSIDWYKLADKTAEAKRNTVAVASAQDPVLGTNGGRCMKEWESEGQLKDWLKVALSSITLDNKGSASSASNEGGIDAVIEGIVKALKIQQSRDSSGSASARVASNGLASAPIKASDPMDVIASLRLKRPHFLTSAHGASGALPASGGSTAGNAASGGSVGGSVSAADSASHTSASFLGTTTIASRAKKQKLLHATTAAAKVATYGSNATGTSTATTTSATSANEAAVPSTAVLTPTLGTLLARMDVSACIHSLSNTRDILHDENTKSSVVAALQAAIKSRLRFDAMCTALQHEREVEDKRLLQERVNASRHMADAAIAQPSSGRNINKSSSSSSSNSHRGVGSSDMGAGMIVELSGADDMLMSLLSSSSTTSNTTTSSSSSSSSSISGSGGSISYLSGSLRGRRALVGSEGTPVAEHALPASSISSSSSVGSSIVAGSTSGGGVVKVKVPKVRVKIGTSSSSSSSTGNTSTSTGNTSSSYGSSSIPSINDASSSLSSSATTSAPPATTSISSIPSTSTSTHIPAASLSSYPGATTTTTTTTTTGSGASVSGSAIPGEGDVFMDNGRLVRLRRVVRVDARTGREGVILVKEPVTTNDNI